MTQYDELPLLHEGPCAHFHRLPICQQEYDHNSN